MGDCEHVLFFPVVVLVALILIVLSFRVLFRLLLIFIVIMAIWYGLHFLGVASPPVDKTPKVEHPKRSSTIARSHV